MNLQKSLIADFYMYEFLVQGNRTYDTDLERDIEYSALVFLDKLKEYLETIMEYSIIREISHIWWESIDPNTLRPPTKKYLSNVINSDVFPFIVDLSPDWLETLDVDLYTGDVLKDCLRLRQYMYIKNHNETTPYDFIRKFKKYFTKLVWVNNFGGEKWDSITNSYLNLKKTSGKDLFTVCDTIFWLQHNTNSIFNKISSWEENGSYDWINEFLDFRKECDLWELWEYCYDSKKLAGKKLKMLFNKTKEDKMELYDFEKPTDAVIKNFEGNITFVDTMDKVRKEIVQAVDDVEEKQRVMFGDISEKICEEFAVKLGSLEDLIKELPEEFLELRRDLFNKIGEIQEETTSYMNDLENAISILKKRVNDVKSETVKEIQSSIYLSAKDIRDYLEDAQDILLEEVRCQVNANTNAILEKLEQRWYKQLWKWFKKLFLVQ